MEDIQEFAQARIAQGLIAANLTDEPFLPGIDQKMSSQKMNHAEFAQSRLGSCSAIPMCNNISHKTDYFCLEIGLFFSFPHLFFHSSRSIIEDCYRNWAQSDY